MRSGQPNLPRRWLLAGERLGDDLLPTIGRMPSGSGVVLMDHRSSDLESHVRRIARARGLVLVEESAGEAARVHDARELRRALARRTPLIFISALFPTRSHPGRAPLPLMRAATLARLAPGPVFALGGMDATRFRRIERLGFYGWGGIDAWLRITQDR